MTHDEISSSARSGAAARYSPLARTGSSITDVFEP